MLVCKKPEYRPWVSWAGQDRLYRAQQAHLLTGTPSESSLLTPLLCCIWYLHFTQHCQVSPAPWLCAGCLMGALSALLELQREKSMDMHLQVRASVCFLFSMHPIPFASLPCHRPPFLPLLSMSCIPSPTASGSGSSSSPFGFSSSVAVHLSRCHLPKYSLFLFSQPAV